MIFFFRADASIEIGSGHIMRCLTLADELAKRGAQIRFICQERTGNLMTLIEQKGYTVYRLPAGLTPKADMEFTGEIINKQQETPEWLIVDHYEIDTIWESYIKKYVHHIMVIDDLANREHHCDLLLDQNYYENIDNRYDNLVPHGCYKLLGPSYALLRPEFIEVRKGLGNRDGVIKRILIFLGGSDPTNETKKVLEAIRLLNKSDIIVDVVVGASNVHKDEIKKLCSTIPNLHYYYNVNNMAQLMVLADLFIGGGGSTTWERCFLGLPGITLIIANNQEETTVAVAKAGASINLGWAKDVSIPDLTITVKKLLGNPEQVKEMSKISKTLVSNKIDKILEVMIKQ